MLLGHKDGDITTPYSAPEVKELIDAVERLAEGNARKRPNFTLLHVRAKGASALMMLVATGGLESPTSAL